MRGVLTPISKSFDCFTQILNCICTLPKAISYGNCHMKIQHNIRVKRPKLFIFNGKSCFYPAISISTLAHWSSSVQKVITTDNAIETGDERFRQILKKYIKIFQAPMFENTFSPLHIPVLVKSKKVVCHYNQIFMWSLGICEPTFYVKF